MNAKPRSSISRQCDDIGPFRRPDVTATSRFIELIKPDDLVDLLLRRVFLFLC